MTKIKDQLKTYFEKEELNQKELNSLKSLQVESQSKNIFLYFDWLPSLASAAVFVFCIYQAAVFKLPIQRKIAEEVVINHLKMEPLLIKTALHGEASKALKKLTFESRPTQKLNRERWVLIGSRYCSIQGRKAAQLRYKDQETGKTYNLFQIKAPTHWAKILRQSKMEEVEGIGVAIWVENGLLMALTSEIGSQ